MYAPAWNDEQDVDLASGRAGETMNIYRTSPQQNRERAAREAAEWLQVMGNAPGDSDRAGFAAWVARSPLHLEELLMAQLVERELAASGVLQSFDLEEVLARAQSTDNVVPMHGAPMAMAAPAARARPSSGRQKRLGWALAAGVAICGALGTSWILLQPEVPVQQYVSAVGEQRSIALADGSMVTLAPASYIAVRFSRDVRDIELRDGEATFDVAHDSSRPFRVHAGDNIVQAVGTRFTVNRLPSGTLVAVSEGRVKVSAGGNWLESLWRGDATTLEAGKAKARVESLGRPAALSAGEQARIPQGQQTMLRMPLEPDYAPVDGKRRLNFRDDTLADIVSEFNRYSARPIVVADPSIRAQRYSGVFYADDADSFLQFLECCSQLQVSRQADRNVIGARGSRQ